MDRILCRVMLVAVSLRGVTAEGGVTREVTCERIMKKSGRADDGHGPKPIRQDGFDNADILVDLEKQNKEELEKQKKEELEKQNKEELEKQKKEELEKQKKAGDGQTGRGTFKKILEDLRKTRKEYLEERSKAGDAQTRPETEENKPGTQAVIDFREYLENKKKKNLAASVPEVKKQIEGASIARENLELDILEKVRMRRQQHEETTEEMVRMVKKTEELKKENEELKKKNAELEKENIKLKNLSVVSEKLLPTQRPNKSSEENNTLPRNGTALRKSASFHNASRSPASKSSTGGGSARPSAIGMPERKLTMKSTSTVKFR